MVVVVVPAQTCVTQARNKLSVYKARNGMSVEEIATMTKIGKKEIEEMIR